MKVWIVLPAYNEEDSIPLLLPKIDAALRERRQEYRVVVVNDGSVDNTGLVLEKMSADYPLDTVSHKVNRGLGETERDGFEFVSDRAGDEDIIVRFDCDNTHEPAYIGPLIDKINEGFDVVNTSRFQPGGGQKGVGWYRALISYGANIFMRLVFNIRGVKDYSCGFRAYRAGTMKDALRIFGNGFIQLKGLGFTATLETIVKLKLLGCRFGEIPFLLRYDAKTSESKMVTSITTVGYLAMALLYHWPFGGWRRFYKQLPKIYKRNREEAFRRFGRANARRSTVCQIGG